MKDIVLVDSHCHLNYPDFTAAEGVAAVLARAAEHGVKYAQTICTKVSDFEEIHALAMANENLFCSYGIHPHHAAEDVVSTEDIIAAAARPKVIGIGETGLDYFYEHSPKREQKVSFEKHLEAAAELELPVIIHTREAEEDTMQILDSAMKQYADIKLLFHCFTSNQKLADFGVERGISFSAPGIITFKKLDDLRATYKNVPLELLMVETDAPYLAPTPHRGKRNEPAYTAHVAECLAQIKGVSLTEIAEVTTNNFFNLFTKAVR